jgi:phosphoglycerate dehydrogenase-like enzyme
VGSIGAAVAERALPFGNEDLRGPAYGSPITARRGRDARLLDELLGRADHLLIALPATARTRRLRRCGCLGA